MDNGKPEKIINMLFRKRQNFAKAANSSLEVMMKGTEHSLALKEGLMKTG